MLVDQWKTLLTAVLGATVAYLAHGGIPTTVTGWIGVAAAALAPVAALFATPPGKAVAAKPPGP